MARRRAIRHNAPAATLVAAVRHEPMLHDTTKLLPLAIVIGAAALLAFWLVVDRWLDDV